MPATFNYEWRFIALKLANFINVTQIFAARSWIFPQLNNSEKKSPPPNTNVCFKEAPTLIESDGSCPATISRLLHFAKFSLSFPKGNSQPCFYPFQLCVCCCPCFVIKDHIIARQSGTFQMSQMHWHARGEKQKIHLGSFSSRKELEGGEATFQY